MPQLQLKNDRTGEVIFAGCFDSAKDCVEQAARENICLDYADLRYANLAHAALDDVVMRHARLDHANLTGANLSEAQLEGTAFYGATLHGACLCFSTLEECNFENSLFGGTDIAGCALRGNRFSMLSAFNLNFIDAAEIADCIYHASTGTACRFSRPPLVIHGLAHPVIFMDSHLKIGNVVKTYEDWRSFTNDNIPANRPDSSHIYSFFRQHQLLLHDLCAGNTHRTTAPEERAETA